MVTVLSGVYIDCCLAASRSSIYFRCSSTSSLWPFCVLIVKFYHGSSGGMRIDGWVERKGGPGTQTQIHKTLLSIGINSIGFTSCFCSDPSTTVVVRSVLPGSLALLLYVRLPQVRILRNIACQTHICFTILLQHDEDFAAVIDARSVRFRVRNRLHGPVTESSNERKPHSPVRRTS